MKLHVQTYSVPPRRSGAFGARGCAVVLACVGLALTLAAVSGYGSAGRVSKPSRPPTGLRLWNTLGSADEIAHSAYGPNLVPFDCMDPATPHFGERCAIDVLGTLAYPPGVFGGAATITGGPYFPGARVHTALLRDSILDPEHGAVEAWYRQKKNPVPFMHNPHRIFGGPYSLTGVDEVSLFSQDRLDSGDPRLHFTIFFGQEPPPFTPPPVVAARSLVDGVEGYPISALNGRWIHVAGVWDRRGIAGTSDTVRLYVNGTVVAASKAMDWGTTRCETRRPGGACFTDVAGCNDTCADTFAVDELKVWGYAKSNYSLCGVPNVERQTLPAAKRSLAQAHCRVGKIGRAHSKSVKRGRVISESPKAGAVLPKGGKVNLVVSRGRKP